MDKNIQEIAQTHVVSAVGDVYLAVHSVEQWILYWKATRKVVFNVDVVTGLR